MRGGGRGRGEEERVEGPEKMGRGDSGCHSFVVFGLLFFFFFLHQVQDG